MIESELLIKIFIFVLAVFVGFDLITKVPPTLHTPLMSGANAISGITILGALLVAGRGDTTLAVGSRIPGGRAGDHQRGRRLRGDRPDAPDVQKRADGGPLMDAIDFPILINAIYLLAAVLIFLGLKRLGSPATAREGNRIAALGMLIAVVVTLLDREIVRFEIIVAGIIVGAAIGGVFARAIRMTAMPQLVALFNGFGGAGSAVVAAAEFLRLSDSGVDVSLDVSVTIMLGTLVGLVTFTGSLVAYGKLQELIDGKPITYPLQKTVSAVVFLAIVGLIVYLVAGGDPVAYYGLVALCLILGLLLVTPIGGADMPVVISLLNSYSGIAAAMAGFALGNVMLIIAGALVGAAGLILTQIMIKAMNRSLANVLFGAFGAEATGGATESAGEKVVREATPEDAAVAMAYSGSAILVPGYGLAVATGAAPAQGGWRVARSAGRGRAVRDPSRRRQDARPHERPAGRGGRALRQAVRPRRDQRPVPRYRLRAGYRR